MAVEGEKLLAAERHLLHTLGFEFTVTHPYMSLNLAVKKIRALSASAGEPVQAAARAAGASEEAVAEALAATPGVVGVESTREIFQVAWNFINDSLRTTLSLQYDAKSIAAAVLYLAARFKKTRLPDVGSPEGARWWDAVFGFPVSLGVCEEIGNQILDLYQQSGKTMLAEAGLQRAPPQAASAPAAAAAGDSAAPPVPREARADVAAALRAPSAPAGAPGPPPVKREGGEHGCVAAHGTAPASYRCADVARRPVRGVLPGSATGRVSASVSGTTGVAEAEEAGGNAVAAVSAAAAASATGTGGAAAAATGAAAAAATARRRGAASLARRRTRLATRLRRTAARRRARALLPLLRPRLPWLASSTWAASASASRLSLLRPSLPRRPATPTTQPRPPERTPPCNRPDARHTPLPCRKAFV
jgi:hypothetical protein